MKSMLNMRETSMHPEQRPNELFLANASPNTMHEFTGWKEKREGVNAYSNEGVLVSYLVPVFVTKAEAEDRGIKLTEHTKYAPGNVMI